ncbi:CRP-like cAMP-binding protein [Pseudobacter ginsenosidimutans]|uniref:CRP-like cAMP-binding protein n=1 Tax=Pseudobacter ginsenosidimutans TaxID=661488 RepID=A0A4Q7MA39_9BACT|nr:Crp/Fnr family transcriptional regulator [Pseudobacter ginsenosidimutans]RZS65045.1 CRP-like cAMP-binding protein [Pseudobacter ginsenosidimutans]
MPGFRREKHVRTVTLKNVLHKIQSVYPLSADAMHLFISHLEQVNLPKGHQLFKEGRTGSQLYLIERGIARAFSVRDNKELTFWFGLEGDVAMSYYSYIANKPGYETVELLEDSVLYSISLDNLQELFTTNIEIANWGRKLAEFELVRTEQTFMTQQSLPAAVRYQLLLEQNPQLIRRVQLGYIASYLGVTQVTLSRIRAGQTGSRYSSFIALLASFSEPAGASLTML